MHEIIAIKIVSYFPSFEANRCVFVIIKMATEKGHSNGRFDHLEIVPAL